jgi:hypothetical protein
MPEGKKKQKNPVNNFLFRAPISYIFIALNEYLVFYGTPLRVPTFCRGFFFLDMINNRWITERENKSNNDIQTDNNNILFVLARNVKE